MKVLSATVGLLSAIAWVQLPGGAKKDNIDRWSPFRFKVPTINKEKETCCFLGNKSIIDLSNVSYCPPNLQHVM